ncbi:hypothetical protein KAI87_03450 [Myxococcota bacterium]|nr:hypothetical protein [Myxococcota bacterium]
MKHIYLKIAVLSTVAGLSLFNMSACTSGTFISSVSESGDQIQIATYPLANAGADQEVLRAYPTCLDASASYHMNNEPITYKWRQIDSEEQVILSNTASSNPCFLAPLDEKNLIFELSVTDGIYTTRDVLRIFVRSEILSHAPVMNAGADRFLATGEEATPAEGDAAEVSTNAIDIVWEEITAEATEESSTDNDTSTSAPNGLAIFRIQAQREGLRSAPDYLILHSAENAPRGASAPIASLTGPQSVLPGQRFVLDASGSTDVNGESLSWRWEQVAGDRIIEDISTAMRIEVTAPQRLQELVFRVSVNDGLLDSMPQTLRVAVAQPDESLIPTRPHPTSDIRTRPGRTIVLDAHLGSTTTHSVETEEPESWVWQQTLGTPVDFSAEHEDQHQISFITPELPEYLPGDRSETETPLTEQSINLAFSIHSLIGETQSQPAVVRIEVVPDELNTPPSVLLFATPENPEPGDTIQIEARMSDAESDAILRTTWEIQADAEILWDAVISSSRSPTDAIIPAIVFSSPKEDGAITINLKVCDEFEACADYSIEFFSEIVEP